MISPLKSTEAPAAPQAKRGVNHAPTRTRVGRPRCLPVGRDPRRLRPPGAGPPDAQPGALAPPAGDLRRLPGVAGVEVAVSPPGPTRRIVHMRDWHYVPPDLFALD